MAIKSSNKGRAKSIARRNAAKAKQTSSSSTKSSIGSSTVSTTSPVGTVTGNKNERGGADKVSNKEYRAAGGKTLKTSFTNAAGEKIQVFTDGTKTVNGVQTTLGSKERAKAGTSTTTETTPTGLGAPTTPSPTGRSLTVEAYDSSTGKGTLSYYARQAGTTVAELAKLNNISDPNTITPGQVLNLPSQGTTQGTGPYRSELVRNQTEYQKTLDNIKTKGLEIKQKLDAQKAQEDAAAAALATSGKDAGLGDPTTTPTMSDEERQLRDDTDREVNRVWSTYERVQKYADDAHNEMIEGIKRSAQARAEQTRDSNARLLAAKGVSNMRQGRSRYTAELAQGILTDEEYAGQARLVELEAELVTALAEAESARAKDRTDAFNDAWDRSQKAIETMNKQIESNYKIAIEQEKLILEREKEARTAQKDSLSMMLDKAEAAAPALAEKMKGFASAAERSAFIQAYAERTGIDPEIIMGEVELALDEDQKRELDMANVSNQIYNRNRTENRLQRQQEEEEEKEAPETSNVLAGITKFNDIEDPKIIESVKFELAQYGLFEAEPPQWFVEEYETQAVQGGKDTQISQQEVQSAWDSYRSERGTK